MKSKWRAYALVAIFAISVAAGLIWHFASKGLRESNSANIAAPFLLGVYAQNPSRPISIEIDLYYNKDGTFADVFLNSPPHNNIVLLSTKQDIGGSGSRHSFRKLLYRTGVEKYYSYYRQILDPLPPPTTDQRGYVVGSFKVPNSTLVVTPKEVIARLPLVGQDEDPTQYIPAAATVSAFGEIYLNPKLKAGYKVSDRKPSHYTILNRSGSVVQDLYWNPEHLTTKERIVGVGQLISGWNISDTPSNGISEGGDYVWQGDYGLSGTITAIDPSVAETRASDEFFSGIALATAAAALIALLQECQDKWPFKKIHKRIASWKDNMKNRMVRTRGPDTRPTPQSRANPQVTVTSKGSSSTTAHGTTCSADRPTAEGQTK